MKLRVAVLSMCIVLVTVAPASAAFTQASAPVRVSRDADTRLDFPAGEHQAEPHVAVDPTDPLHLVATAHEGRLFDGGAQAIGAYVSWDGGRTWTNQLLPRLTVKTGGVWERATDPVAGFAADGTAYINSFAFNRTTGDETAVVLHRSDDGGLTWKGPFTVDGSDTFRQSYDKNWMAIDTGANSPNEGRIYVAWTNFISGQSGSYSGSPLLIAYSDDRGVSWSEPVRAARTRYAQGAIPMVTSNGTVHVVYTELFKGILRITTSTDGGATWGKARVVANIVTAGVPGLRTAEDLSSAAVDQSNGTIHVVWQDARTDGGDVLATRSRNGGVSWSAPILVNDDPEGGTQFTPAVAARSGTVHVVWYDSRDGEPADDPNLWSVRFATSANGGRTFGTNVNLTPTPFDMRFAVDTERGKFLGDYIGLAATATTAYPVWVDTRFPSVWTQAQGQNDVVSARVR